MYSPTKRFWVHLIVVTASLERLKLLVVLSFVVEINWQHAFVSLHHCDGKMIISYGAALACRNIYNHLCLVRMPNIEALGIVMITSILIWTFH
jgi:hypothetical protein